eukprot:gb/GEZN01000377.1/.p1 GENE.gb/GEZN01000377.1/~~gb/GEZN01000377.1/.p1  ORF type:complete len:978 (+),score=205.67 gb/GEZN01000377.1/:22-2955(+)
MSTAGWKELQQVIFSRWVKLKLAPANIPFESVLTDFKDGIALVALIEILSEEKLTGKPLVSKKMRAHDIDNCNRALEFLFAQNVKLELKPSAENLVDGDERAIMSLVWGIMLRFLKFSNEEDADTLTAEQSLLMWVNNQVSSYGIEVTKFDKAFHDGKVYASIIHKNRARIIDPSVLTGTEDENCEKAFTAATAYFGLERYIQPSDIPKLDSKSQFVFCSEFYYGVARERKKDLSARRISKLIEYTKVNDGIRQNYHETAELEAQLLAQVNAMLTDRSIDNTMAGAVKKLDDYYSYKKENKKTIMTYFLKMESLNNILHIRLTDHKRPAFNPGDNKSVEDFKRQIGELDILEAERGMELNAELTRQKLLVQINKQHVARYNKFLSWFEAKLAYLQTRETSIETSGSAGFELNRFANYEDDVKAVNASTVQDLLGFGRKLDDEKYENFAQVEERQADLAAKQDILTEEGTKKKAFLDDSLLRTHFKEKIELLVLKFSLKADSLDAWCSEKETFYLKKEDEINSVNGAELAIANLESFTSEKKDLEGGPMEEMLFLGGKIQKSEYKSELSSWKYPKCDDIKSREDKIKAALETTFPELIKLKRKGLNAALAKEVEKQRLRLLFANQAGSLERFAKAKSDDYSSDSWFGETLDDVIAVKSRLNEEDTKIKAEAEAMLSAATATFELATQQGVTENVYTTFTPESLTTFMESIDEAILGRHERYNGELARVTAEDELCQEFAKIANPLVDVISANREVINSGKPTLEEEKAQLEVLAAANTGQAETKQLEEIQSKLDAAHVSQNKHSKFTAMDVLSRVEQYNDFLASKLQQLVERMKAESERGITAEQLAEIDLQFVTFDKNSSRTLDKNEFTGCLYSLGEERPSSEVKAIMSKYGDEKGIPYQGFKDFMLTLFGDTETEEEILKGFKCLALGVPEPVVTDKNLTDIFTNMADIEYLRQEMPKEGDDKYKYVEWTTLVFAR